MNKMNFVKILVLCWLALLSTSSFAQQSNQQMAQYQLGAGDVITINVYGEPELSMTTRLPDVGTINYPFLGEVKLVGLTLNQVESTIYNGLLGDYLINPSVSVNITEYRPFFIDGAVKKPGGYPYQPGLSVNKAAAIAGGYTERADKKEIQIVRTINGQSRTITVSISDMIQPGDVITVANGYF
tara:strand:+ start:192 stop:743 length:552 start_codon:yes stop_codon:yes gene_type:complete